MSASNRRGLQSLRRALAVPGKLRPQGAQSSEAAQLPFSRAKCPAYLAKRVQRVEQMHGARFFFFLVGCGGCLLIMLAWLFLPPSRGAGGGAQRLKWAQY